MYVIVMRGSEDLDDMAVLPTIGEDGQQKTAMFKTSSLARSILEDMYGLDQLDMEEEGVEIWHVH
jgi:hypothetical protein